jgi:hypothetical protein
VAKKFLPRTLSPRQCFGPPRIILLLLLLVYYRRGASVDDRFLFVKERKAGNEVVQTIKAGDDTVLGAVAGQFHGGQHGQTSVSVGRKPQKKSKMVSDRMHERSMMNPAYQAVNPSMPYMP